MTNELENQEKDMTSQKGGFCKTDELGKPRDAFMIQNRNGSKKGQ